MESSTIRMNIDNNSSLAEKACACAVMLGDVDFKQMVACIGTIVQYWADINHGGVEMQRAVFNALLELPDYMLGGESIDD